MTTRWRAGWWSGARRRSSPNFGPRPAGGAVSLLLVHSISLPPGEYGGDAIERLFTNQLDCDAHPFYDALRGLRVSAHFLLRRDGSRVQFVSCYERAWHAGASSWRGRADCNNYSIGIELEGTEGELFEDAQYSSLVELALRVAKRYPIDTMVGHEHVAPVRKRDPGAGFDWMRLRNELDRPHWDFPDVSARSD